MFFFFLFSFFLQSESVAECSAQLRVFSKAFDVRDLRLNDRAPSRWKQEVARLRGVAMRTDCKEALLEGWGLVLQANLLLDPQSTGTSVCSPCLHVLYGSRLPRRIRSFLNTRDFFSAGVLERLRTCVDQQQGYMASFGLLDPVSEAENEQETGYGAGPDRGLLLRLARRAQLWPVLEELAILNQMKVTADLLHQSVTRRSESERQVSDH